MKKTTKKIIAISILGALPMLGLNAQSTASNRLMIPQFDNATLVNAGCDPNNWNKLVSDYTSKRGYERQIANSAINEQVISTPAAKGASGSNSGGIASCFQSAAKNIDQAMTAVNALMALYSGGTPDFSSLGASIMNQLGNAACKQLDYQLGQATGSYTGQVTGLANQTTGTLTGNQSYNTGTSLGSVNLGSVVSNTNGTGTTSTIPYVGSGSTSTTGTSWFQSLNPFSSTGSTTNGTNPLK